jgi:hypothetical protein
MIFLISASGDGFLGIRGETVYKSSMQTS